MNCLYCGEPLATIDEEAGWHRRCSRSFFGTDHLPTVDVTTQALESLAVTSVGAGKAIAGVQRKLSVHLSEARGAHRLTLFGHPTGFILKPQTSEYSQLPEIEQLTMTLAERVGIKTVPHGLIGLADGSLAYITRRVDRDILRGRRIPMEDMCQLSERLTDDKYRGSYEQVFRVIARHSARPGIDGTELFLALVFCFVTGNADMHLKNFSLFRPDGEWVLAPMYDLVATAVVLPDDDEETALTLNGKKRRLRRSDFVALGESAGIHRKATVGLIDAVLREIDAMTAQVEQSPLEQAARERYAHLVRERAERLRP
jgi:serine/threonine-protein kinase HipA